MADYEKVTVEGTSNPVCIYLEIGEGSAKCRTLLARVDLGQLGFSERIRRHFGNTQEIWVKGKVPSSSIRERTSWPIVGKSNCGLETWVPTRKYERIKLIVAGQIYHSVPFLTMGSYVLGDKEYCNWTKSLQDSLRI